MCCIVHSTDAVSSWWMLSIVMIGKSSVTLAFQVLYLYTSELYPTCVRTQGLGVTSMVGRCGAIASPFVTDTLVSELISRVIYRHTAESPDTPTH